MQILAIYWKNVWQHTISRNGTRVAGHTDGERAVFDRRMAAMRAAGSQFVRFSV